MTIADGINIAKVLAGITVGGGVIYMLNKLTSPPKKDAQVIAITDLINQKKKAVEAAQKTAEEALDEYKKAKKLFDNNGIDPDEPPRAS